MEYKDDAELDKVFKGDYKRRSSRSFLFISVMLLIGAVLIYPKFKGYLSSSDSNLTLWVMLPWFLLTIILIIAMSAIPVMLRRSSKQKEAEILRYREQAELLSKYNSELDESSVLDDFMVLNYEPPKKGEKFPTYRPPVNSNNDPYAAKPKGFAEQQAKKGYPQAPAQMPLPDPTSPMENPSIIEFEKFKETMLVQGVRGNEMEMYAKFELFKQIQGQKRK